jgi:TonB family protein
MTRLSIFLALAATASAQTPEPDSLGAGESQIIEVAEVQPELMGGMAALAEDVVYPEDARVAGVEGTVVVQFVVIERGEVVAPVAVRSPSEVLSEAALAAVHQQTFTPGLVDGLPVKVRFAVPITFRLAASEPDDSRLAARPLASRTRPIEADSAEVPPAMIGGLAALSAAIEYSVRARPFDIQGEVIVQFVVDEVGSVIDPVVVRSPHDLLSEAALAAIRRLHFTPGQREGLIGAWPRSRTTMRYSTAATRPSGSSRSTPSAPP